MDAPQSRFIADDSANEAQQLHAVFDLDASRAALKSRAGTALPQIVVVITENRQREVGMCYSDLRSGHTISLCQFTDNQSSSQTLSLLDMLRPVVIAFSVTQKDRQLFQRVFEWVGRQNQLASATGQAAGQQRLHTTQFLPRKAFDEVKGEQLLRTLAVDGDLSSGQGKYLALASLCAWKAYVEAYQHLLLSPKSYRILWPGGPDRLCIDYETARLLELTANARTGEAKLSLYGVLNGTKTAVGARLLQAELLSPRADARVINGRLDAVDALLSCDQQFIELSTLLPRFPDLDALLSNFAYMPRVRTPTTARQCIGAAIALKHTLAQIPAVAQALAAGPAQGSLLMERILESLQDPVLGQLQARIDQVITEDTSWCRNAAAARTHEVFAIRPALDGALDVIRDMYASNMSQLLEEGERLRTEWGIPGLKLNYTSARGHHLVLPAAAVAAGSLPAGAIQAVKQGRSGAVACTTDTVASLNERIKENLLRSYVLMDGVLQSLMEHIRHAMCELSRVVESVALVDLCCSFAGMVLKAPNPAAYCRPSFTEGQGAPTVVLQGRHPILEKLSRAPYVPNDLRMGAVSTVAGQGPCTSAGGSSAVGSAPPQGHTVLLLTGPNCSGKSTYLRQTALLHIMAHIGSYVPAFSACFRVTRSILARLGTGDDLEGNASSFLLEMRDTASILSKADDSSLVLIDELGRGTSNEDGVGICWAVVEDLALRTQAHVLVTTHYHELGSMARSLPQVRNMSMAVDVEGEAGRPSGHPQAQHGNSSSDTPLPSLNFRFTLTEGSTGHKTDYGLALAALCGLPETVLQDARLIKAHLAHRIAVNGMRPGTSMLAGLARPATGATASRSTSEDGQESSTPSFASAVVARDTLLFTLCNELLPVLDSIENGAASVDDVYAALFDLQTRYGPALSAAGVDGTLAQSVLIMQQEDSMDASNTSVQAQGAAAAQESMVSSGIPEEQQVSVSVPSSIDTSRPGTAASVLLQTVVGRGHFAGIRFQQPPSPATANSKVELLHDADEDDMPYRDAARGGVVVGSRDCGVQYSQDGLHVERVSGMEEGAATLVQTPAVAVGKADPVRGRMAPPPLPSTSAHTSLRPLPWHRAAGSSSSTGSTSVPMLPLHKGGAVSMPPPPPTHRVVAAPPMAASNSGIDETAPRTTASDRVSASDQEHARSSAAALIAPALDVATGTVREYSTEELVQRQHIVQGGMDGLPQAAATTRPTDAGRQDDADVPVVQSAAAVPGPEPALHAPDTHTPRAKGAHSGPGKHAISPANSNGSPDAAVTAVDVSAVTVVDASGPNTLGRTFASDAHTRTEDRTNVVKRDEWMDALDQLF